jgi:hypothetical protein
MYSTETALNRIQNDLLLAMNRRQVSALVLLDLSAAFDTIDHDILLSRLQSSFGLSDTAFQLLSSYLCNRSQSVQIDQSSSDKLPLLRGVPQGSVLGPLLFTLYTTPLSHLLTASSIHFHLYADDTQLYVSFTSPDSSESLAKLSATLDQVFRWFCSNRLSVNPSKTEYLLIGTPQQRCKVTDSSVFFNGLTLLPTDSARNLLVSYSIVIQNSKNIYRLLAALHSFISVSYGKSDLPSILILLLSLPNLLSILNLITVTLSLMVCLPLRLSACSMCKIRLHVWSVYLQISVHIPVLF